MRLIGLTAHLYSLLAPALGAQPAGLAMGLIRAFAPQAAATAAGDAPALFAAAALVQCLAAGVFMAGRRR
jgi:hypothetical protein